MDEIVLEVIIKDICEIWCVKYNLSNNTLTWRDASFVRMLTESEKETWEHKLRKVYKYE